MTAQAHTHLDVLDDLPTIGLDDLMETAALQTRRDRKYLLPLGVAVDLLARMPQGTKALSIDSQRCFRYESVYFDTADYVSYLAAAHRRPQRFKVRTRSYLDSGACVLEVKTRDARGRTVKHREPYDLVWRSELSEQGRRFVTGVGQAADVVDALVPMLSTEYRRATLLVDEGSARVTVDTALRWCSPSGATIALEGMALIETKTSGRPCSFDRALWLTGRRPITISKYCTGLAALTPDLPANKWNRVLRTRFRSGAAEAVPVLAERSAAAQLAELERSVVAPVAEVTDPLR